VLLRSVPVLAMRAKGELMPIKGARYRVKTTESGKKVRLAFKDGEVVEAKGLKIGKTHTPPEFRAERKRKGK